MKRGKLAYRPQSGRRDGQFASTVLYWDGWSVSRHLDEDELVCVLLAQRKDGLVRQVLALGWGWLGCAVLGVKWEKQRRFARKSLSAGRGRWPALLPHSREEPWSRHPNLKGESQRFAGKGVFCRRAAMGTGQMASVLPHGLGKALRNGITGETRLELHEGVGLSYSSIAVSEGAPPRQDALLDRDKHPVG